MVSTCHINVHDKQTSRHLSIYKATQHNSMTLEEDFFRENQPDSNPLFLPTELYTEAPQLHVHVHVGGMNLTMCYSNQGKAKYLKATQPDNQVNSKKTEVLNPRRSFITRAPV